MDVSFGNAPNIFEVIYVWAMQLLSILWFFGRFAAMQSASGEGWGYGKQDGPHSWPGTCQNHLRQSPINIRANDIDYTPLHRLHFINYDYDSTVEVQNTGKTLIVKGFDKWMLKQPMIQGGGLKHRYKLAQFHLHWGQNDDVGSEHSLGSLHYPGEIHLVHIREGLSVQEALTRPDGIAVVGVFLAKTSDPIANKFSPISDTFPFVKYSGNKTEIREFRPSRVLPYDTEAFYRYEGSLTTPDCSEAVIWTILAEPLPISNQQLHQLRQLHDSNNLISEKNYRPLQPLNGRRISYRPAKLDRSLVCSFSISTNVILAIFTAMIMTL
ncbi:unnamed protein product [Caenorhabditis bovis]|uniref:Carbonic anhydrase n=1 Tax=Caenorhabditis bovis TaxID=2654633 RepID=A0A8S1ENE3_9PELO|nr:unnamed protein product [Caenorhabditis bovis]